MAGLDPAEAKALGIQVIYQDLSLFPNLSVAENIAFDRNLRGLARPVRFGAGCAQIAGELLAGWAWLCRSMRRWARLSIAERQVVAICRGLAADARLLFMDEPTASLTRAEVDRAAGLRRAPARPWRRRRVRQPPARRGGRDRRARHRAARRPQGRHLARGEVDARRIGELMTGLVDRAPDHRPRPDAGAAPLLEVRGLTRAGEYADVAFTLHRGEVLGLTGLLGAGRTELALSLFGMTRPDAGEIRLEGRPIALATNQDAIRAGIAYVSEDRLNLGLNMRQSVGDNLVLASLDRLANALGWIAPARRRALAADWVETAAHQDPGPRQPGAAALGRQPAARRAGQVAGHHARRC